LVYLPSLDQQRQQLNAAARLSEERLRSELESEIAKRDRQIARYESVCDGETRARAIGFKFSTDGGGVFLQWTGSSWQVYSRTQAPPPAWE
jgi:hypothetical protein